MAFVYRFLCKIFKHKAKLPEDLSGNFTITCLRCGCLLSQSSGEDQQTPVSYEKSYLHGCIGKSRFTTFHEAEARMARMKVRPATLHTYFCDHCHGFHLGNSRKRWK
jgi:hypothetical protein